MGINKSKVQHSNNRSGSKLMRSLIRSRQSSSESEGSIKRLTKPQYLSKSRKKQVQSVSFVLLGSGESGKSTILKQVTSLYLDGFSQAEKEDMKPLILNNVIEGCVFILEKILADEDSSEVTAESELSDALVFLKEIMGVPQSYLDSKTVEMVKLCLDNECFKEVVDSRSFFLLQDTWLEQATKVHSYPDWGGEDWEPSKDDIIKSRVRTIQVNEVFFQQHSCCYRMTDFSGQKHYRMGYMIQKFLKGIDVVLYVQSLSEYNLQMFEEPKNARFIDSLDLWTKVVSNQHLQGSAFVLFFNKLDMFNEKYVKMGIELPTTYTDFRMPPKRSEEEGDSCTKAKQWYEELYKSKMTKAQSDKLIVHFTTATDENIMKNVIEQVTHVIVERLVATRGFSL